jgi:hypothetical protein
MPILSEYEYVLCSKIYATTKTRFASHKKHAFLFSLFSGTWNLKRTDVSIPSSRAEISTLTRLDPLYLRHAQISSRR